MSLKTQHIMKHAPISRLLRLLLISFFFANILSCYNYKHNKVLIIGIDGCKPDALLKAKTPNIDKLWKNGSYSFSATTDELTISGPCWTSMLTGVWHDKHKVITNKYLGPNIKQYPHLFKRVKQFNPDLKTYSIVNWEPVNNILNRGDADFVQTFETDEEVVKKTVDVIKSDNPDIIFVQLDEVDIAGHTHSFDTISNEYLKAISDVDEMVGQIVNAMKSRASYEKENWLIILSTDHGGSGNNHGENIKEHKTIFYIVSGKRANQGLIKQDVYVTDVSITALHHMGIPIMAEWDIDGRVIGLDLY